MRARGRPRSAGAPGSRATSGRPGRSRKGWERPRSRHCPGARASQKGVGAAAARGHCPGGPRECEAARRSSALNQDGGHDDLSPVSVVLVGVGGYGLTYVNALLDQVQPARRHGVGVVDPSLTLQAYRRDPRARHPGVRGAASLYRPAPGRVGGDLDAHPPAWPADLRGARPRLARAVREPRRPTIQEVAACRPARDRTGALVAIGYQWSFSEAVQALKADILLGRFGTPKRLRTLVLWPRNGPTTGATTGPALRNSHGRLGYSPVNNATAHLLHNHVLRAGSALGSSAMPVRVTGGALPRQPDQQLRHGGVRA